MPCNWLDQRGIFSPVLAVGWQLVLVLVGFLIMIISLVPGAQFWFGLLEQARHPARHRPEAHRALKSRTHRGPVPSNWF